MNRKPRFMRRVTRVRASVYRQARVFLRTRAIGRRVSRAVFHGDLATSSAGTASAALAPWTDPRSVSNRGLHGRATERLQPARPVHVRAENASPRTGILRPRSARGRCAAGDSECPQEGSAHRALFGAGGRRPSGAVGRRPSTRLDRTASKIKAPPSRMVQAGLGLRRPPDTIYNVFRINSGTCGVEHLKRSRKDLVGTVCDFGLLRRFRFAYEKRDG